MTEPVTKIETLDTLSESIKAEHSAVVDGSKDILRRAMKAGDLLNRAKDQVPHGKWGSWLKDRCQVAERTAQLYMQLASGRRKIEEELKSATVADLTLNQAARLVQGKKAKKPKSKPTAEAIGQAADRLLEMLKEADSGIAETAVTNILRRLEVYKIEPRKAA
jgi:hypothetical protein